MKKLETKIESWPIPLSAIAVSFVCWALIWSLNPIEWTLTAVFAFVLFRGLLQTNSLPLRLAFVFPFLELSVSLLDAEFNGSGINEYFYGHGSEVYTFSLLALGLLYFGWNRVVNAQLAQSIEHIEDELGRIDLKRLIIIYFVFQLGGEILSLMIPYRSSLFQLTQHIRILSVVQLLLIIWRFKAAPDNKGVFLGFLLYVLFTSLFSFFSSWKILFIQGGFVLLTASVIPSARALRNLGITVGLAFIFVLTWQAVKVEYRDFLNQGTRAQRISVSQREALVKFSELVSDYWFDRGRGPSRVTEEMPAEDLVLQSTLERVGYLDLFCRMRQYVPSEIPHERGALLKGNLSFALIPRILNPNKGRKNDQLKVEKYAKRRIADNASFSLGHFAEHYIDFGKYGMLFSLLLFGLLGGVLTKNILRDTGVKLAIHAGFCYYFLQYFVSFQFDAIKIYGQVFWAIVTYKFIWLRFLEAGISWSRGEQNG